MGAWPHRGRGRGSAARPGGVFRGTFHQVHGHRPPRRAGLIVDSKSTNVLQIRHRHFFFYRMKNQALKLNIFSFFRRVKTAELSSTVVTYLNSTGTGIYISLLFFAMLLLTSKCSQNIKDGKLGPIL